jgi:hypothetical protein
MFSSVKLYLTLKRIIQKLNLIMELNILITNIILKHGKWLAHSCYRDFLMCIGGVSV